jgi:uncharacterized membrane protein
MHAQCLFCLPAPPRSVSVATPQIPRPRIQSLSDLIFGLALSIGAIQLGGSLPTDPGMLTADLAALAFTFLILISVWNRYTSTTSVMPVESPVMIRLNMLLLFLVAIEPFLFDVLYFQGTNTRVALEASLYYGLDIGGMNLILAYFTHLLTMEEKNLVPRDMIHRLKISRNLLVLTSAVFLASDLPVFWDVTLSGLPLRVDIWIVSIPLIFLPRLFTGSHPGRAASQMRTS